MRSSFPLSLRSSFAIAGLLLLAQREGAGGDRGRAGVVRRNSIAGNSGYRAILGTTIQAAGEGLRDHCIVTGKVIDRIGVDGTPMRFSFELRLPATGTGASCIR